MRPTASIALSIAVFAALPLVLPGCGSAPTSQDESTGSTAAAISGSSIVSRATEWVDAELHYCQAAHGAVDNDDSCWAWEGPSHRCDRENKAAWDAYRSDCSGFVTFAWGLPAVGDGGYVTGDFAPYSDEISHTIEGIDLEPGDALNKTPDEHIVLFKEWSVKGKSAVFMEEPGCSSPTPYAHEFTSDVSIHGSLVYIDYEGASFYAIRSNGSSGGSSSTEPSSTGSSGTGTAASKPASCKLDGHSYATNTCTETRQCDNGSWVARPADPSACKSAVLSDGSCLTDSGSVELKNTCTETLQCDDGVWVDRFDDPTACR